ncbi:RHS repeat domain-containing protein [Dyadobacter aurulentus]|uniref:RHS repeat domain-containing protein n=1 Tax=Dyadobacter sp. UC 10 TaxID=2605428 RepID=UPI0011F2B8D3|nr:RHS repeat-associated core domain-containing protein [Dyadobacter sp. UC 10]
MTQDAGQQARGVWEFTKYDALNRIAMTGEVPSALARTTWQANLNASQAHHEDKQGSGLGYTLANTLPNVAEANVLTVLYYDDYTFPKPAALAYTSTFGATALSNAKGQQTGSRARMLGGAANWLVSAVYFDAEYRIVQTVRELYDLGAGALERTSLQYKYDLAPVVAQEKTEQITGSGTNVHLKTFEYDHADRLLSVQEKIVNGNKSREAVTVAQRYNTVGQLQQQWFHSENAVHFRRRTTHSNNIRGWLTQSKTSYKAKDNVPESVFYNVNLAYASGNNYTNGNISQMQWSGKDENTFTKGLSLSYDGANRLLGASGLYSYKETETGITYDKNGNFKTLIRAGTAVDNLVYASTGNRISSVTDGSGNNTGVKSGASGYSYDANGNMTGDGSRGAVLAYNYLDLPRTVAIGGKTFSYDYDASGRKHKYVADTLTVKYAGDFEYDQSNALKRISVTGGQVVHRGDSLRFDYFLKDHLGNVRIVFDEMGRILQRTDYYPFGLEIDRNDPVQTPAARNDINRLTFIGRESQVGTGYIDLQARFYDPGIGRFMGVDPDTEGQLEFSPYHYSFNNPMRFSDPDGRFPECCGGLGDFFTGFGNALTENIAGEAPIRATPGYIKAYNSGRAAGHYAALVIGATEVAAGIVGDGAAVVGEIGSAGLATPLAVPVALVSTGAILHGSATGARAVENLRNDNGRVNIEGRKGSEGNPHHSSRAARREAMREAGIPTSSQPKSQSKNQSGREYNYGTKSVQQQTKDRTHQGKPHWEAGKIKQRDGKVQTNHYGRPKLENVPKKSKSYYNE